MRSATFLFLVIGISMGAVGCGGEGEKGKGKTAKNDPGHEGHNHGGGDHIGANSAHKIEFKDAPFNAKWEHAGDLVTFHIVDNEYKKEVSIAATELVVTDKGGKNTFKIPAVEKNDKGEASEFELADEKLELVMDHEPTMTVKVGDKEYKTTVYHIH